MLMNYLSCLSAIPDIILFQWNNPLYLHKLTTDSIHFVVVVVVSAVGGSPCCSWGGGWR